MAYKDNNFYFLALYRKTCGSLTQLMKLFKNHSYFRFHLNCEQTGPEQFYALSNFFRPSLSTLGSIKPAATLGDGKWLSVSSKMCNTSW